jgi:hypothetical protein
MVGESADADEKAEDFTVKVLPGLIERYAAEDIYNADETGLLFKCLPDKTYGFSNEKCYGGNKNKNRLTVMVCCYMTNNDNVELHVIGKIQKSRCFKVFTGPIFRQYFARYLIKSFYVSLLQKETVTNEVFTI